MNNLLRRLNSIAHSIRFRLVLWFAVILSIVLAVFSSFVYYNQLRDIRGENIFHIERKLTDVLHYMQLGNGKIILPDGLLQTSDILVLLDSNGKMVASQASISPSEVLQLLANSQGISASDLTDDQDFPIAMAQTPTGEYYTFVTRSAYDLMGSSYVVIVGSPSDPYGRESKLKITLILGSLLTLAIALGGGFWLADRAMRPVHSITQTARQISESDLSRRITLNTQDDELGELASTFNAMLSRLELAFQRQRQFIANASHELRTPLTIVNLEAGRALAGRRSTKEYQRALTIIQSENEFMTRLVNDLLILARIDNHQTPIEKLPVDLGDIALEAVERLEPLAARHHVRLETGDLPEATITGHRQYLLQMVSNLIENGIKYAGKRDAFVRVETGTEKNGAIWLRVQDNGQGIEAEHLTHLFERFYRADPARARSESEPVGGSGLGLSIVQSIAQAHEGTVEVESTPDQGTTFLVRFHSIQPD